METNSNPNRLVAEALAAPFTLRGQGNPLSFKPLHDGGMVVITADGRKLWFSAAEVQAARRQLRAEKEETNPTTRVVRSQIPIKLAPGDVPAAKSNNGLPVRVATGKR
jgi:hypothetical protein